MGRQGKQGDGGGVGRYAVGGKGREIVYLLFTFLCEEREHIHREREDYCRVFLGGNGV